MPKIAANLTMLFNEVPFPERFQAAADAGFKAVEYLFPYVRAKQDLKAWLDAAGLQQVLINMPAGDWRNGERGTCCLPDRRHEFRDGIEQAIDYARFLDCQNVHVVAGVVPDGGNRRDYEDSWVTDAHKWLNVPYDCSLAIVRDPDVHRAAMGTSAPYLPRNPGERSPEEWVPELSRRARAIPVYAAIRGLGREGVALLVENGCDRAQQMASLLADESGVEVLNDVDLNQVLVRFSDDDEATERVIAAVQDEGTCWVGGTTWKGRRAMRVSITNWATSHGDIARSAAAISAAAGAEHAAS